MTHYKGLVLYLSAETNFWQTQLYCIGCSTKPATVYRVWGWKNIDNRLHHSVCLPLLLFVSWICREIHFGVSVLMKEGLSYTQTQTHRHTHTHTVGRITCAFWLNNPKPQRCGEARENVGVFSKHSTSIDHFFSSLIYWFPLFNDSRSLSITILLFLSFLLGEPGRRSQFWKVCLQKATSECGTVCLFLNYDEPNHDKL